MNSYLYKSRDGRFQMEFYGCRAIEYSVWSNFDRLAIHEDDYGLWSIWLIPQHNIGAPKAFMTGIYTMD